MSIASRLMSSMSAALTSSSRFPRLSNTSSTGKPDSRKRLIKSVLDNISSNSDLLLLPKRLPRAPVTKERGPLGEVDEDVVEVAIPDVIATAEDVAAEVVIAEVVAADVATAEVVAPVATDEAITDPEAIEDAADTEEEAPIKLRTSERALLLVPEAVAADIEAEVAEEVGLEDKDAEDEEPDDDELPENPKRDPIPPRSPPRSPPEEPELEPEVDVDEPDELVEFELPDEMLPKKELEVVVPLYCLTTAVRPGYTS